MPPSFETLAMRQNSRKISAFELSLARPDGMGGLETKTLRLSDRPIAPGKTSVYFEPRLRGVPYYRQSIQEAEFGRSQIGFGRLVILNGDAVLDADLAGWNWQGRPVVHKLGFAELEAADYRTVFTGFMEKPRRYNNRVEVSIKDRQAQLWKTKYPAGTYTGTLATLVGDLLTAAGITNIDSALWADWAADNPFNCWYEVTSDEGEEVGRLIDNLLAPLACWYGISREDVFRVGTFKAPDAGTPDLTLPGRELFDWYVEDLPRVWKISVEYWTATGSSPETGWVTPWSDSDILDLDEFADDAERTTLLTSLADAETILARWVALLSVQRHTAIAETAIQPALLELHDQFMPTETRHSSGTNWRVTTMEERRGFGDRKNRMKLELWQ